MSSFKKEMEKDQPKIKPETRRCGGDGDKGCGIIKPLTEEYFKKNKQQPFGLDFYCKKCRQKQMKTYRRRKTAVKRAEIEREIKRIEEEWRNNKK